MILVMTATVKPAKISQLCLTDTEIRLKQYCTALNYYINSKKFDRIVFCDNSDYPYEYKQERQLAQRKHVQLEILKFKSSYGCIEQYGKGYGEGEILKYVMLNSHLMKSEDYFYKVTGRLIVRNLDFLVKKNNKTARFDRNLYSFKSLDTRFWGINKEVYIRYLMESYKKVNDNKGNYIEMVYKKEMEKANIQYKPFRAFPLIEGYSGTIGKVYRETTWYTRIIYDFMCFFEQFNTQKGFCIIFVLYNVVMCKKEMMDSFYTYLVNNGD